MNGSAENTGILFLITKRVRENWTGNISFGKITHRVLKLNAPFTISIQRIVHHMMPLSAVTWPGKDIGNLFGKRLGTLKYIMSLYQLSHDDIIMLH